uniref:Copine domain-containing protein n=1 Tax=Angiostrongylus cantonensis TaxID=6313 RepID=A0A0K0D859_ANGCA
MNSVHETSLKLDYLQGVSNDHGHSHSVFESQDVYRQHNLLALSSYLLQSQSRMKENSAGMSSVRVNDKVEQTKTQQDCSLNKERSSKFVTEAQKICNEEVACIPSTSQSSHQECVGTSEVERQIGPDQNIRQSQHVPNNVSCDPSESNGRIGGRSLQTQRYQAIPRISAYASSYSATPRGILTRLSLPELRLRVQQIKNICAGDHLYPQELAYMLLVIGDITQGGNRPQESQFFYAVGPFQFI